VSVLLDELGLADVRRLRAGSRHRAAAFQGAPLLIVEHGFLVTRAPRPSRRGVVTAYAGPGGLLTAPEGGELLHALVDARVAVVSDAAYAELLADPRAAAALSDALRSLLRQQRDSLAAFARGRPVERVEHKLLQLAGEYGVVSPTGVRLDFPLTHELLGDMIGCARETVSRSIDRLESAGFVVREGRSYCLQVGAQTLDSADSG
jgi:hypothetical protein